MLQAYGYDNSHLHPVAINAQDVIWIDLLDPTPAEVAAVTRETGLSLPNRADLLEIESSSRLSAEGPVLTLSTPVAQRTEAGMVSNVCGFVLAPDRLVTLRFAPSRAVEQFIAAPHLLGEPGKPRAAFVFVSLLEVFVDHQADALERLRDDLDRVSHRVFRQRETEKTNASRRRYQEAELRMILVRLGQTFETLSILRDSALGIARIAPYVQASAEWLPKSVAGRLKSVSKDIVSLNEFSAHLTGNVQFLLDATLGLINIAQNGLIKVLTVVSIVGIPPTLIAGIYGMNFKDIPELSWTYGYAYAWVVMILSAILPLILFRLRGWL